MFRPDQLGRVNRDVVGEYGAEELLVVAPDLVKHRKPGWNAFDGHRIGDATGNPLYPLISMTAADLDGVRVEKVERG